MTNVLGIMGHPPDADEALGPLEQVGYVVADMRNGNNTDQIFRSEPTVCLGFMCPARWDACDDCHIAKRQEEIVADFTDLEQEEVIATPERTEPLPPVIGEDVDLLALELLYQQSLRPVEAQELMLAPTGRGKRASLAFHATRI